MQSYKYEQMFRKVVDKYTVAYYYESIKYTNKYKMEVNMAFSYRKYPTPRPIGKGVVLGMMDRQRILPPGWCPACGGEIFARGMDKCLRCAKEEKIDGRKKKLQPLS